MSTHEHQPAPLLATAMANLRAASTESGPGSERARLGRLGGGRRERDDEPEQQDPAAEEPDPGLR